MERKNIPQSNIIGDGKRQKNRQKAHYQYATQGTDLCLLFLSPLLPATKITFEDILEKYRGHAQLVQTAL